MLENVKMSDYKCFNENCPGYNSDFFRNCETHFKSMPAMDACPDRMTETQWNYSMGLDMEPEPARPAATPEPMSTGNGEIVITELIRDLLARDEVGKKKYHTTLKTDNGRDALNDAFQEALDLVMYLKQAIMEREASKI